MPSHDELRQENEVLRDRISTLNDAIAATLRITASLDVSTVLQEIVESACALTGARYGTIMTVDEAGQPQDYTTFGFTPEQHQQLLAWTDGLNFVEHLQQLPGPVRLEDLSGYIDSLGYSPQAVILSPNLLGTQMRHRGVDVGGFYLAAKAGGEKFTSEDEEVLVLFASQAAAAVVNARRHRDERRARADLAALIDTSPVGVVVFDAKTGDVVSLNREAKRIVGGLSMPGRPMEKLPEIVTCRRADGREIAFTEFPLAQIMSSATTVRAEEIVLKVPDGRSVTTLVNATTVRGEDGTVESVVVTLQDMAPIEELERMRAEFLGMVSHEMRFPLISIKGSTSTVLSTRPTPNLAEILQIIRIIDEQADHMRGVISDLLDAGHITTGTLSVSPESEDLAGMVEQARSTFLSGGARHAVHIDLPRDLPRMMADRQRIVQVINNLLANAARYSPESAPIQIAAVHEEVHVAVSITDEGRGVPADLLPHVFRKHVRVDGDRGIRGSGLGLAICKGLVEAHGGRIWAESEGDGLGARFTFTIPVAEKAGAGAATGFDKSASYSSRTDRERTRILVVDDDPQTLRYVRDALSAAGYSPVVTGDAREVPGLIRTERPELVVLDLVLPGRDGIELMQDVPEMADLPVIFISGYKGDETISRALEMGAADYIVKPFSTTELSARVRAALRRRYGSSESFRLGELAIHYENRQVTVAGQPVRLTATEYELLRVLSVNAGRILTYDSLLRQVWTTQETTDRRVVHALVKRLRGKLGDDASKPDYIMTERRVGYRMPKQTNQ